MFSRPTHTWFSDNFTEPTPVQREGWARIAAGDHALLVAPTGSGKTLAAFLAGIDRLMQETCDAKAGVRVLYVSPLKALVYDVERNLRAPLTGILRTAERLGEPARSLRVDMRTGDTPQAERRAQLKDPAQILVTTPESLFLLLGSKARENLRTVHTVIIDEVHALAPSKRGAHLALSLERLAEITDTDPQRIGLSATVNPPELAARFLGGDREVSIVDTSTKPALDLHVEVPVADMEAVQAPATSMPPGPKRGGSILGELYAREVAKPTPERGIWPAMYPALVAAIRGHRSTLIFVNSRGLAERLTQRLNEVADEPLVLAHHGSVSHERRAEIEEGLKAGRLKGIVATSSLELGVDMGAVDLVILVESPGSVARGLQRVGRAGHQVGAVSRGIIYPKFRGDLLECAVVSEAMLEGLLEPIGVPRNPLDVLAQQLVAMVCDTPRTVSELEALVRRTHPYRELSRPLLEGVLDMLSGHYPSAEFADLRPWLAWDRAEDRLTPRRGAPMAVRLNAGTIPDRGLYAVHLGGADGPRLGELDEEMVFETRAGENILLGASTWRVEEITRDRVIVSPAPGEPGKLPFWHGDSLGRPVELGRRIGALTGKLGALSQAEAARWLEAHTPLSPFAAGNLAAYVHEQKQHTGVLPTDTAITVERFRDELGDWRACILSPFGARIHAPWGMALQNLLSAKSGFEVQVMYTDDGIVLRFADTDALPDADELIPDPEEIEALITEQLATTALFAGLFRENAARALMLTRNRPEGRTPLWAQRMKSAQLLATVSRYPAFPIVLETYRQALSDVFDLAGLKALLADIRARRVRVDEVETRSASPFARSLVFAYVAAYIYEQDAPLAERRAQALTLDRGLLAELLGQAELRELLDADVLAELEAELAHETGDTRARDADELHDLLRRLGDQTTAELSRRCTEDPAPWLETLMHSGRAAAVRIAGEPRFIAAEDAGLYRDALGVAPPPGLPDAFLVPVPDALEQLLRRFARTRGPFVTKQAAARFGLTEAQVIPVLRALLAEGRLVQGELRPGGSEPEWCDVDILRRLKRRTLASLRHQATPVEARALARFLPEWHGITRETGQRHGGAARLMEVVAQLEGLPLPWSLLAEVILPARVSGFTLEMLDMAAATGQVVWVGVGAQGPRDGRVTLYRRERAPLLLPPADELPDEPLHRTLLEHLDRRGASFYLELETAVQRAHPEANAADFRAALWDLVWAGAITNDTFAPLRALARGPSKPTGRSAWRGGQALAGGRWSRVSELRDPTVSDTEQAVARAEMLLERYGIVSREAALAENLPGGFGAVYGVLRAMEESGRIRRGYFVEGLSGAQFAWAGSVDRIRGIRLEDDPQAGGEPVAQCLAAMDPANPFGTLLPWPEPSGDTRPRRVPGAWVILADGLPVLYLGPGGKHLVTLDQEPHRLLAACRALHQIPRTGRRRLMIIEQVDGVQVNESGLAGVLLEAGFVRDYRGFSRA
ncbi:DEAD/DEAH box helicase [Thioalkalivibrio sulfidiphilus]|uniref:DEAD/DEAH box helicase n=1 Tax=Thioalkalivibrio sulfidiphilus TaxID=1033854 RepID=UPI003BB082B0